MSIYFEPDHYPEPKCDSEWAEWLERNHAQIMREQRRLVEARALAAEEEVKRHEPT